VDRAQVTGEQIREFVRRARGPVQDLKRSYWSRLYREQGPQSTMRAGHAMYLHVREVRPEYPTDRERRLDLQDHLALKKKIDSVAHAFADC
jgi:hypothetical protein